MSICVKFDGEELFSEEINLSDRDRVCLDKLFNKHLCNKLLDKV